MASELERAHRKGVTLAQLVRMFPNDNAAAEWFEDIFWGGGRCCPKCESMETKRTKNATPMPYWCKDCRRYFSVRTGTAMARSHISLRNWAFSIYLVATNPQGISSMKLHRDLGISQKAAWFMLYRIREAFADAQSDGAPRRGHGRSAGQVPGAGGMSERDRTLAEKERQALIRHWEGQLSPNPDFKGKTSKDIARALVRPKAPLGSRCSRK